MKAWTILHDESVWRKDGHGVYSLVKMHLFVVNYRKSKELVLLSKSVIDRQLFKKVRGESAKRAPAPVSAVIQFFILYGVTGPG